MIMYIPEIQYECAILVRENGTHFPILRILDNGTVKILEMLGTDEMQNLIEVEKVISELEDLQDNIPEKDYYIFKKCYYLKVKKDKRIEFHPESISESYLELDLILLLNLFITWSKFLDKYENRKIHGIIYS